MDDDELSEYLAGCSPEEKFRAMEAITFDEQAGEDWRRTPTTMAHHLTNGTWRLWKYATLLGEKFADAVEGRSIRQIWTLPPRYGKSKYASQWGPAWMLDRYPDRRIILNSYGDMLAMENAFEVRKILREHRGVMRAQLQRDRQERKRFMTTEGGGVLAAGYNSAVTGFGAHGLVGDDLFKNWQEAHSATIRQAVDDAVRSVMTSRLDFEESFAIIAMTRWHENDIVGRLVDRMVNETGEQWEVVRIPELAEVYDPQSRDPLLRIPDPLGRSPGEPIEPERYSLRSIRRKHLAAGSYLTAAMYQGRPAPEEGGEVKRAWFNTVSQLPPAYDQELTSWDMKLKDKESGSFVVGQYWGRTGSQFWFADQLRGQWNQATTECAIVLLSVRHPTCTRHVIENTGNGPEVMVSLRSARPNYTVSKEVADALGMTPEEKAAVEVIRRRGMVGIIGNTPKGPKTVRMRAVSPTIEGGYVNVLESAVFLGIYLDEVAAFPNGANDDQVDATSQALSKLTRGTGAKSVPPPSGTLPKAPINTRGGGTMGVNPTRMPGRMNRSRQVLIPKIRGSGR